MQQAGLCFADGWRLKPDRTPPEQTQPNPLGFSFWNVPRACARAPLFCQTPKSPRVGLFFCLVLGGYMLATRYKTLYRWLHGGYMSRNEPQNKKPCYRFDSRVSCARAG